jgi:hypothetical protein
MLTSFKKCIINKPIMFEFLDPLFKENPWLGWVISVPAAILALCLLFGDPRKWSLKESFTFIKEKKWR